MLGMGGVDTPEPGEAYAFQAGRKDMLEAVLTWLSAAIDDAHTVTGAGALTDVKRTFENWAREMAKESP